jgi:NosR/NirI family transcriptional regulator, nitrous oxide reductase regulator
VPPGESWREVLAPQALDLALLGAFLALAMTGFFLKSVRVKYATLAAAVAYMGFSKSHLISIVDLFGLIDRNLPIAKYNIAYYGLGLFVIVSTVLWGRVYCGRICAFGALTQLMDATLPARLRVEPPAFIERRAAWIKYGLLGAVLLYYVATRDLLVYRFVEPFWMFGLFGSTPMWIGLGVLLVATVFVRNLYCRFLCPVGAMLGIISNLTVFKIKRWSECNTCRICEKACEWGAIRGPKIVESECVRCDDCERLYHDRKKCPHWIILLRARPSAPPPARAAAPGAASSALGSST